MMTGTKRSDSGELDEETNVEGTGTFHGQFLNFEERDRDNVSTDKKDNKGEDVSNKVKSTTDLYE